LIAMREMVLDTETTGLDPLGGHRIGEIGAVELVNRSRGSGGAAFSLPPEAIR
jgi:DNA polymerase-3 subunit epsilon